jgi:hypothetical protein
MTQNAAAGGRKTGIFNLNVNNWEKWGSVFKLKA